MRYEEISTRNLFSIVNVNNLTQQYVHFQSFYLLFMRKLLTFTICLFFTLQCCSQISVKHKHTIKHLLCDSLSNIYFVDENNNLFRLSDNKIIPYKSDFKRITFKQSLKRNNQFIIDGKLKALRNNKIINLEINSSYIYKNGNVSIEINNQTIIAKKQSTICSYRFLENIIDALYQDDEPYLLTRNSLVKVCNNTSITLPFTATSFTKLDDNSLLISSKKNALWLYKNNKLKKYYTQGITFPDQIKLIKKHENSIWILAADKTLFNYNIDHQLLKRVAVNVEDFALDYWHKLWYATNQSITSNINFINKKDPLLKINHIIVNEKKISNTSSINLKNSDKVTIDYQLNYSPNNKIPVSYKLSNESKWKSNKQNPIRLKSIDSDSRFIEIKTSRDGEYFTKPLKINFNISSSFWGSFLSYVFIGLTTLIALMVLSHLRVSHKNKLLKAEKKALKLELEVTKKEQKLGQLQLNPHFIFNTMNSINGLIALDKKSLARRALSKFATIMRTVLSFSFDERIYLDEELTFLNDYMLLEQLIRENKFDYTINSDIKNLEIPPMIIQPFVENAIIHGLQHKKEKGQLDIEIAENNRYIKVIISDNGIGRKAAQQYRKETHNSSAIKIVKDRIAKLDKWKIETPITYIDLYENAKAMGTKCILQIPK